MVEAVSTEKLKALDAEYSANELRLSTLMGSHYLDDESPDFNIALWNKTSIAVASHTNSADKKELGDLNAFERWILIARENIITAEEFQQELDRRCEEYKSSECLNQS